MGLGAAKEVKNFFCPVGKDASNESFPGRRVLDGQWIEPTEEQVQALAADQEKEQTVRRVPSLFSPPGWLVSHFTVRAVQVGRRWWRSASRGMCLSLMGGVAAG